MYPWKRSSNWLVILIIGGIFSCAGCGFVKDGLRDAAVGALDTAKNHAAVLAKDAAADLKLKAAEALEAKQASLQEKRESGDSTTTDFIMEGLLGLVAASSAGSWLTSHKAEKRKKVRDENGNGAAKKKG
jgi:hypothetical protein